MCLQYHYFIGYLFGSNTVDIVFYKILFYFTSSDILLVIFSIVLMMIHRSRQCFVLFHFLSLILLKSDVGNGLSISSRGRSLVPSPLSQRLDSTYYSITRTPSRTQPKFLLTSTRNNDEGMVRNY